MDDVHQLLTCSISAITIALSKHSLYLHVCQCAEHVLMILLSIQHACLCAESKRHFDVIHKAQSYRLEAGERLSRRYR